MKKYCIYAYEFSNKYCYIGLTNNSLRRDAEHHKEGSVFQHSQVFGEMIPKMKILEGDLDKYSAQKSEENWSKYYVDNNWTLINKAKMGLFISSTGGSNRKVVERIFSNKSDNLSIIYLECLEEAKKYNYLIDFRKLSYNQYQLSRKHGWKYEWLKKTKPINRHKISDLSFEEIKNIASSYKTRTEFSLNHKTLYMKCLSDGSIDKLFPKANKALKNDSSSYANEELLKIMLSYHTKSEFHKMNQKIYNICRLRGLLKQFPKKETKSSKIKYYISKCQEPLKKMSHEYFFAHYKDIITIPKYGEKYIFNKNDLSLYYRYKTTIAKVRCHYDKYGVLCYNINKHYVYIFELINDFIYDGKYNLYKFIDKNFTNISIENIDKTIIDLNNFSKMAELDNFLIDPHGNIYSTRHKMIMENEILNGYSYFRGFKVDKLIVKYFHPNYNKLKNIDIIHKDGNLTNNDINNLDICLHLKNKYKRNLLLVKNIGETNEIYINDSKNNREYFLGLIKNEKIIKAINIELTEYIYNNTKIDDWVGNYQGLEFKKWQEKDRELNMIATRVNSDGCYYSEIHKLWKSKVYFKEKEYSLGYFHTFEAGKILYEEAILYIKYNKFKEWYADIKSHRKKIKLYFRQ